LRSHPWAKQLMQHCEPIVRLMVAGKALSVKQSGNGERVMRQLGPVADSTAKG
jgi:hypothetical protein